MTPLMTLHTFSAICSLSQCLCSGRCRCFCFEKKQRDAAVSFFFSFSENRSPDLPWVLVCDFFAYRRRIFLTRLLSCEAVSFSSSGFKAPKCFFFSFYRSSKSVGSPSFVLRCSVMETPPAMLIFLSPFGMVLYSSFDFLSLLLKPSVWLEFELTGEKKNLGLLFSSQAKKEGKKKRPYSATFVVAEDFTQVLFFSWLVRDNFISTLSP